MVRGVTYTHNLDRYIDESVPPPTNDVNSALYTKWKYERGSIAVMLTSSVIEVRDKLRTAGLAANEMDPYVIYSKVCSTIPKCTGDFIGDLIWRFIKRQREEFDSLEAFQKEYQYLRRRMQELNVCPPDKFMVFGTLKKLEETMPRAYPFLEREFEADNLTWDGLMEAISREKNREKAPALAALALGQQPTQQPTSNTDWEAVFRTLPKLKGVDEDIVRSLSWCHECRGFMWKGYSHHSTALRNGCGNCHLYGECPNWRYDQQRSRSHKREETQQPRSHQDPQVFGAGSSGVGGIALRSHPK